MPRLPRLPILLLALVACLASTPALGDDAKDTKKKDPPKVVSVSPLGVLPGSKVTLRLRGVGIETAKGIRFTDVKEGDGEKPRAEIKSKGKGELPKGFEAKTFGDGQVEFELAVPAGAALERISFVVVTGEGETEAKSVRVLDPAKTVAEKEPNGGFREAQPIEPGEGGKTVVGVIGSDGDVDVFAVTGKAGRTLSAEVSAARAGSPLDGLLTLYDAAGRVVARSDDAGDSHDPAFSFKLPADGAYYLALTDANDHGSPSHAYLLNLTWGAGKD